MSLSIEQASERLGVHRNTIFRMRQDGRLKATKSEAYPQGRVLIDEASVKALLKKQATERKKGRR
ncbi:helix-turn-helix domain-containing protein [Streptosporangium sp. G12]